MRRVPRDDFDEAAPTTVYERKKRRPKSLEEIAASYEAAIAPFVLGNGR